MCSPDRLHHRHVRRLTALEDAADMGAGLAPRIENVSACAIQADAGAQMRGGEQYTVEVRG